MRTIARILAALTLFAGVALITPLPANAADSYSESWTEFRAVNPGDTKTTLFNTYGANALNGYWNCKDDGEVWEFQCATFFATGTSQGRVTFRRHTGSSDSWIVWDDVWDGQSDHYGWYEKCLSGAGCFNDHPPYNAGWPVN